VALVGAGMREDAARRYHRAVTDPRPAAPALALALASCLAVSACAAFEENVRQTRENLHGLVLLLFGVPATLLTLVGVVVAVRRGVKRSPRRYLNLWLAILVAGCAAIVHLQMVDGLGRRPGNLFCLALSSTPLLWLAAAVTETVLAPTSPRGPDELPVDRSGLLAATLLACVAALVLYGVLLDHGIRPSH
jgi:hypothetical protein